jgi:hypothetical protein
VSDLLGRLVERALGTPGGVHPRVTARFEPPQGLGPTAAPTIPVPTAAASGDDDRLPTGRQSPVSPDASAAPRLDRVPSATSLAAPEVPPLRIRVMPPDSRPVPTAPVSPPGDSWRAQPVPRSPAAATEPVVSSATAAERAASRSEPGPPVAPDVRRSPRDRDVAAAAAMGDRPSDEREARQVEPVELGRPTPVSDVVPAARHDQVVAPAPRIPTPDPAQLQRPVGLRGLSSPVPAADPGVVVRLRPSMAPDLDHPAARPGGPGWLRPVVRVSIGRIDVRAVQPPVAAERRPAHAPTAAPSLEDYLRARNGRTP